MSDSDGQERGDKLIVGIWRQPPPERQGWAEPLIARLATETWRLGRRLRRVADDERLRALHDSVSRLEDALAEYRVEVVEHEGQAYDPGLRVEVLHEGDGVGTPMIVETIRPTVVLEGRVLQQGQVITATLDEEDAK